jgi:cellobiose-specific phosphotransferase system component IIB
MSTEETNQQPNILERLQSANQNYVKSLQSTEELKQKYIDAQLEEYKQLKEIVNLKDELIQLLSNQLRSQQEQLIKNQRPQNVPLSTIPEVDEPTKIEESS